MLIQRKEDILAKIQSRIVIIDLGYLTPCHIWQGPTSGDGRGGGYGRMSLDGQTVAVHIVIYTHFFGYIPSKKQIDHKCNNRLCCNPEHLEMVTHLTNQKRRAKRAKETKALNENFIGNFNSNISDGICAVYSIYSSVDTS